MGEDFLILPPWDTHTHTLVCNTYCWSERGRDRHKDGHFSLCLSMEKMSISGCQARNTEYSGSWKPVAHRNFSTVCFCESESSLNSKTPVLRDWMCKLDQVIMCFLNLNCYTVLFFKKTKLRSIYSNVCRNYSVAVHRVLSVVQLWKTSADRWRVSFTHLNLIQIWRFITAVDEKLTKLQNAHHRCKFMSFIAAFLAWPLNSCVLLLRNAPNSGVVC